MIPQAGIFSAIPFTQINSKTMIVALLARPAEKSGPCAGCGLLLWGALKTREKTEGTECSIEKGSQSDTASLPVYPLPTLLRNLPC